MGVLLSRIRKKKSTIETLEKLDNDIKEIEENRMNAQRKYKKITKWLLVYSLGLYVIFGIIFYFQYTSTLQGKILYLVPLALSPFILYIVKIIISWYYVRLINKNQIRLNEMKKEKKRILDEVMDKETYKVAKEILDKFSAPEISAPKISSNSQIMPVSKFDDGVRKRNIRGTSVFTKTSVQPLSNMGKNRNQALHPVLSAPTSFQELPAPSNSLMRLPAPILPLHRSYVDRVVEYLIGDGVNNRFALICSQCHSHNGMALKEEFEYISYKCCYCFFYNPARKVRPEAPKLERRVSDADSEKTSGENSDMEHEIRTGDKSTEKEMSNTNNEVDVINPELDADKESVAESEVKTVDLLEETESLSKEQLAKQEIGSNQPETVADCDQS